jgi:hypothetical protein
MDKFETITTAVLAIIGIIVVAAGIGLLIAFPIKWCWNYAVVAIWHLPVITWGQAWCLSFLSHVLIKSSLSVSKK